MPIGLTIEDLYIDEYYFAKKRARELGQDDGDFYEDIADDALMHLPYECAERAVQAEAHQTSSLINE